MEFSFKLYNWLNTIHQNPAIVIFACGFGTPLLMVAITIITNPIVKMASLPMRDLTRILLYFPLLITWFSGFFISGLLLFSGADGIRLFLVICVIYLCAFIYCLSNLHLLNDWKSDWQSSRITD